MKRRLVLILSLVIFLFIIDSNPIFGQKIIEYKGDTLIVITPQNVKTMNSIIVERNYLEKEVSILNEINLLKDSTILEQEKIIQTNQESLLQIKDKNNLIIQEQAYSWKKKAWKWSGVSAVAGIILGIILTR